MLNKSNLALMIDESYNYKDKKVILTTNKKEFLGNNIFLTKAKYSMIVRENILASGMEVTDIQKAKTISEYYLRR